MTRKRTSRERSEQAIKRGIRTGLRELSQQLFKMNDPAALEACGLILLASARLLRDRAGPTAERNSR